MSDRLSTLRDHCRDFVTTQNRRAMMRVGDPVQELMEFVLSERGRHAAPELDETLPLCLYFGNEAEREDFIRMVQQINPNMQARKVQ